MPRRNGLGSKGKQAGEKQKVPFSMSLYRVPAEGMAQVRDSSSHLKGSGLKVCPPTSKIQIESRSSHFKSSKNPL